MPPKSKITKEMIIDAAFAIARKEGAEKITARAISEYLKCSTQPVLYHFATIEEIKKAAYGKTNEFQLLGTIFQDTFVLISRHCQNL